jgi:hypothetical protein
LRLSKGLVNQESGNALRAPRFDGSDKQRGASREFTHANDFMALSALLRNFYAPSAHDCEALLGVGETNVATTAEQPIPISHPASTGKNKRKNSEKRKERFAFSP